MSKMSHVLNRINICHRLLSSLLYISVKKKELSEAARDYLAEQTTLKLEYDLYYHIRTRLLEQMRRLDISPEPIL